MRQFELTSDQLSCLSSPVRNEVFSVLRSLESASARDLAERLGRSPESLHYHIKALSAAGLIHEAFRRPTSRKPEAVYKSIDQPLRLPNLRKHPELAELTRKTVEAGIRHVLRGYSRASKQAQVDQELRKRLHVLRVGLRLSEDDIATFFALIEAANKFAQEHRSDSGIPMQWSSVVYPEV